MQPLMDTILYSEGVLSVIDQRLLPSKLKRLELHNEMDVFNAIQTLAVRGAPAIGICAAYGVAVSLRAYTDDLIGEDLKTKALEICDYLAGSRPTAVNLFYALDRAREVIRASDTIDLVQALLENALNIHESDLSDSEAMSKLAERILSPDSKVLTHCNTGALATGGGGTALAVIYKGYAQGLVKKVWVDETRPLLQGARLTAWELGQVGVPYDLICDNMAGMLMSQGEVDVVILGADRIASNGDFANKIGTYALAVLAKYHNIPFYTVAPVSSFDRTIDSGVQIEIEQREKEEILRFQGIDSAPEGASAYNPAFDVTPHSLLSGIICEKGLIQAPFKQNIQKMVGAV